ncbi:hypothetical protein BT93_L0871 [Corymbia citriodora subsp. variegata]|uniref:CMP/dCMP-type deaminase domain-containing protein n=1 Tax=Corymbia citriodora subsp. variegata TaxID=360336 RepID=A0A8T0CEL2_CORYI|nr:hypothetical protein BT93_L0871 [Corymbia citriodora subsp. variegata]
MAGSSSTSTNFDLNSTEIKSLATAAIAAKTHAYCPYSNFRVGASFLTNDGKLVSGANVEVASTPVGICAERCALAPLVAQYERPHMPRIRACAVSTDIWPPASCCGMCRQMMREFCELDMKVYMYGRQESQNYKGLSAERELEVCGEPAVMTMGEMLPMSFGPNDLKH